MPDSAHDARSEAGWYPSGLRLGLGQERGLRRWPANRIRPKSIALGVRSLFAEVDALRIQLAASEAALARAEARTAAAKAAREACIVAIHRGDVQALIDAESQLEAVLGIDLNETLLAAAGRRAGVARREYRAPHDIGEGETDA
jgi:hypothetical protein